jgi:hypothetical protein
MIFIKNPKPDSFLKVGTMEKMSLKKIWQRLSRATAYYLNRVTNHWKQMQQKLFLATFCGVFLLLLVLSFWKSGRHMNTGHISPTPKLPPKTIKPENQTGKAIHPKMNSNEIHY